jgi:hypothetical protein
MAKKLLVLIISSSLPINLVMVAKGIDRGLT